MGAILSPQELLRIHRFHQIDNDLQKQVEGLGALATMRPKFYCLNDDQGEKPDSGVNEAVRVFLAEYYPEPSEFERVDDVRPQAPA